MGQLTVTTRQKQLFGGLKKGTLEAQYFQRSALLHRGAARPLVPEDDRLLVDGAMGQPLRLGHVVDQPGQGEGEGKGWG